MLAFAEQLNVVLEPRKFLDWLYARPGDWFLRRDSGHCPVAVYLTSVLRRRVRVGVSLIAQEPVNPAMILGVPPPAWVLHFMSLVDTDRSEARINAVQAASILRHVMEHTEPRRVPDFVMEIPAPNLKLLPPQPMMNYHIQAEWGADIVKEVLVAV